VRTYMYKENNFFSKIITTTWDHHYHQRPIVLWSKIPFTSPTPVLSPVWISVWTPVFVIPFLTDPLARPDVIINQSIKNYIFVCVHSNNSSLSINVRGKSDWFTCSQTRHAISSDLRHNAIGIGSVKKKHITRRTDRTVRQQK
jgi:hypothetical protein